MTTKSLFYIILLLVTVSNINTNTTEDNTTEANTTPWYLNIGQRLHYENTPPFSLYSDGFLVTESRSSIQINCGPTQTNYSTLRKFDYRNPYVENVQFLSCPLPVEGFKHLLDRLRIKIPSSMEFRGGAHFTELTNQLSDLENLEQLSLSNIEIKRLSYLPKLHTLQAISCVTHLSSNLFEKLPNLKSLELHSNGIAEILDNTFQHTQNLVELSLENNNLKYLTNFTFATLSKMKELILRSNDLIAIDSNAFKNLINVWLIDLSRNNLSAIPSNLFEFNSKLQHLRLSHNPFITLLKFSAELPKLRFIDLSFCRIRNLDENLLHSMSNLTSIYLEGNNIHKFPDQFFQGADKLEAINLGYNDIENVSNIFGLLENLKAIRLDNNRITSLKEGDFVGLTRLERIGLSHNNISAVYSNYTFAFENRLETIDVSYNNLDTHALEMLTTFTEYLTTINFANNNVSYLSTSLLRKLASGRGKEIHIDAASNAIKRVEVQKWKNIGSTPMNLDLSFNPILCNCENFDFFQYLKNDSKSHTLHITGTENINCSSLERDALSCAIL